MPPRCGRSFSSFIHQTGKPSPKYVFYTGGALKDFFGLSPPRLKLVHCWLHFAMDEPFFRLRGRDTCRSKARSRPQRRERSPQRAQSHESSPQTNEALPQHEASRQHEASPQMQILVKTMTGDITLDVKASESIDNVTLDGRLALGKATPAVRVASAGSLVHICPTGL